MRAIVSIVLLLVSGFVLDARGAASSGPERAVILGREYVCLSEWASQRSLNLRWTAREECQVLGPGAVLVFTVNSQRMILNGVKVWLSSPVASHRGEAWVTPLDLGRFIEPVLTPRKAGAGRVRTICLDAGHGGKDTGRRQGRREEKVYTLALAKELGTQLSKAGFRVVQTRSRDVNVELPDRPAAANSAKADLFLSLHFNAGPELSDAQGAEVYCLTPVGAASSNAGGEGADSGACPGNVYNQQNMLLAYHLQKAIVQRAGAADRGVKRARYAVLRTVRMPAALIEGAFMSQPAEMTRIQDTAWRRQLAAAIVQGVQTYARATQ